MDSINYGIQNGPVVRDRTTREASSEMDKWGKVVREANVKSE
jgi:hypothetical protein